MAVESLKVAIIGAGPAGLAAARVMSRNGIRPVVFEKNSVVGGVWNYVKDSEVRPMYRGLRTNLPRELMAYREKPWGGDGVGKSYVTHKEVLEYLQGYKTQFGLDTFISCSSEVTQLTVVSDSRSRVSPPDEKWPCFQLEWHNGSSRCEERFDAVCVCNGHHESPSIPTLPGMEHFGGTVMHSVAYDDPSKFKDQTVLCIGGRASGLDIAKEISQYAEHVYVSDAEAKECKTVGKVTHTPRTLGADPSGRIKFGHNAEVSPNVDCIVFCTGYDYSFPFINDESKLDLSFVPGERRVMPLYRQLWHAQYPNLSFVGLQHSILPFPLFELQTEAIVAQFKDWRLPSRKERETSAHEDSLSGGAKKSGLPKHTHYLGSAQWEYHREMAELGGVLDASMEHFIATNEVRAVRNRRRHCCGSVFADVCDIRCYFAKDHV